MKKEFGIYHFFSLLILVLILYFLIFSHFGISSWDFVKFIFGLLVVVYIPGQSLCWFAKLGVKRMEMATLAVSLGLVSSTVIYKFARILGLEWIFLGWLLLSAVYFVRFKVKNPFRKNDFNFRITSTGVVLVLILISVTLALAVDNYRNGIKQSNGSVIVNMHYYDGFIRNAVVREVSHTVPPQMPFAAGFPLSYHYGMDLFISMFYRYLDLGVLDLIHRLSITCFFWWLVAALFIFIREVFSSEKTALLGIFLITFGSGGFSYLATYLLGINQWGNLFFSFYFFHFTGINSILPAVAILASGFFCLSRFLKNQKFSWLLITAFLLALVLEYKMFFIAPITGALLLTGGLTFFLKKNSSLLKVCFWTLVFASPLIASAYLMSRGGPQFVFKLKFVDWIRFSLQNLKFITLQKSWGDLIHRGQFRLNSFLSILPVLLIYFVGSFGMSILALPSMFKELFKLKKTRSMRMFLIIFFIGCILYYFMVNMSLEGRARNVTNIYVYFVGLMVITIFWAEKVINFCDRKRRFKFLILTAVLLLSIPNSARLLWIKNRAPQASTYPASFLEVSEWMHSNTEIESTILHPLRLPHACYFIDRRVDLDNTGHSFLTWHLSATQIQERREDINKYFQEPRWNAQFLDKYDVYYIME